MKRLNGMDAMLLYGETPNLHMHTLKGWSCTPTTPTPRSLSTPSDRRSRTASTCWIHCASHFKASPGDYIIRSGWRTAKSTLTITCESCGSRLLAGGGN